MIWVGDGNKLLIGTCATIRSSIGYYCVRGEVAVDVHIDSDTAGVHFKDVEIVELFSTQDRELAEKIRRSIQDWEDYRKYW